MLDTQIKKKKYNKENIIKRHKTINLTADVEILLKNACKTFNITESAYISKLIIENTNNINIDLLSAKGNFTVKIFDINGIVFDEFTAVGGEQRIVPNPIKGVVFVQLYNNEKTKTFKLLN